MKSFDAFLTAVGGRIFIDFVSGKLEVIEVSTASVFRDTFISLSISDR